MEFIYKCIANIYISKIETYSLYLEFIIRNSLIFLIINFNWKLIFTIGRLFFVNFIIFICGNLLIIILKTIYYRKSKINYCNI